MWTIENWAQFIYDFSVQRLYSKNQTEKKNTYYEKIAKRDIVSQ